MGQNSSGGLKKIGIGIAALLAVPLVLVAIVGVRTMNPLTNARESLSELEGRLGEDARYVPAPDGAIPGARMELFIALRSELVEACGEYGSVRKAFDTIDSLETRDPDREAVGEVVIQLGGAAFEITPFLARYFALRNAALLASGVSLEEYAYIYSMAYHDWLMSAGTRREIFSGGEALSPTAAVMLRTCLERQQDSLRREDPLGGMLEFEIRRMKSDSTRIAWQDGLPAAIRESVGPYRARLDELFCAATAGLEMERGAKRAIWLALE